MALNFGGLLAGASESIVRRVEKEEERLEQLAKEQRALATRQRAARESERRKKQAVVDEYTGLLKMYGMDEDTIGEIAGYGASALETAAGHAKTVFTAGGDINTVYRFSTTKDPSTPDTQSMVDQTTEALQANLAEDVPALTQGAVTSSASGSADTGKVSKQQTIKAAGLTIDQEALRNFFPIESEYSSVGAMEAGLLSKRYQARKNGNAEKEAQYDAQLQDLYQHKKDIAASAREEDKGDGIPFHTPSSATSLYNTMQRTAGDLIGVQQGELGQITSDLKGDPMPSPMRDYIASANMLTSAEDDPAVTRLASGVNRTSVGLIKNAGRQKAAELQATDQYAKKSSTPTGKSSVDGVRYFNFGEYDATTFTPEAMDPKVESGFKFGETIVVEDNSGAVRLMVYTGVPNPLLNGSKYIVIQ